MSSPTDNDTLAKIVALCKRRGFIFQSSEIYGGINGFWDYGPHRGHPAARRRAGLVALHGRAA